MTDEYFAAYDAVLAQRPVAVEPVDLPSPYGTTPRPHLRTARRQAPGAVARWRCHVNGVVRQRERARPGEPLRALVRRPAGAQLRRARAASSAQARPARSDRLLHRCSAAPRAVLVVCTSRPWGCCPHPCGCGTQKAWSLFRARHLAGPGPRSTVGPPRIGEAGWCHAITWQGEGHRQVGPRPFSAGATIRATHEPTTRRT
jgi:hypothetical protein